MSQLTPPTHDLLTRERWCWDYLLVDGVRLSDAEKRLYQTNGFPEYVNLYAGTDWDSLTDVAPLLISISDEDLFAHKFLAEGFYPEWGYLIRSSQGLHVLARQLRQYLQVRHLTGAGLILRLADPGAAGMLFTEVKAFCSTLTGVQELLLPDIVRWQWRHIEVAGGVGGEETSVEFPLVLSDQEVDKLGEVDEWSLLKKMTRHLDTYFPDWAPLSGRLKRSQLLGQLLARARKGGYTSERAQGQWTNVFGYSGHLERLEDLSPELLTLLDSPPKEADFAGFERLASEAATLARLSALVGNHENSRTE